MPLLKCLLKAKQMLTFPLEHRYFAGLVSEEDEDLVGCMQESLAACRIAPLFSLCYTFPTKFCSLEFSFSSEASNWHWKIVLVSLLKDLAFGTWCWKNECHFSVSIIATGNTKEWDKGSVHTEAKQLPALHGHYRLKRERKEQRKKSSKHKHVKTSLMIHLYDLSSSSVATTLPTRHLPVANWKQQIYTEKLMHERWQPKPQRSMSFPRLVREQQQL